MTNSKDKVIGKLKVWNIHSWIALSMKFVYKTLIKIWTLKFLKWAKYNVWWKGECQKQYAYRLQPFTWQGIKIKNDNFLISNIQRILLHQLSILPLLSSHPHWGSSWGRMDFVEVSRQVLGDHCTELLFFLLVSWLSCCMIILSLVHILPWIL